MKTLLVDDSSTMRRILVNSLARIGYKDCVEAEDGLVALTKFDSSIDLIISDWNMPNMSGLELVRAIRSRPDGAQVGILMVTTRSSSEDVMAVLQAGANHFIVKPFTPEILKEKIDRVMGGRQTAAA